MVRLKCLAVCLSGLVAVQGVVLAAGSERLLPAAEPPAPVFGDVELLEGGMLTGHVTDVQGRAMAGVVVAVGQFGRQAVQTTTDRDGNFSLKHLTGGSYFVAAGTTFGNYRLWLPGTAPPGSRRGISMLVSDPVVRGQSSWFWSRRRTLALLGGVMSVAAVSQEVNERQPGSP